MTSRTHSRPLVGMPVGAVLEYTGLPYFGLNGQYVAALKAAGADVVLLPAGLPAADAVLDRLDARGRRFVIAAYADVGLCRSTVTGACAGHEATRNQVRNAST